MGLLAAIYYSGNYVPAFPLGCHTGGSRYDRVSVDAGFIVEKRARSETIAHCTDQPCCLTPDKAKELLEENRTCDITKAKTMLEYRPAIDLVQGTEITVGWYRKNNWL